MDLVVYYREYQSILKSDALTPSFPSEAKKSIHLQVKKSYSNRCLFPQTRSVYRSVFSLGWAVTSDDSSPSSIP